MSLLLARGLQLGEIQTFPAPLDFLVTQQRWLLPVELSRIPSQPLSRYTFLSSPLPSGATRSPQSCSLACWAWDVGSVQQGQFLCFESLPEHRQALCQLSYIPGQQETVNF